MMQQLDAQFVGRLRTAFAAQLPEFLPKQRWFRSKARQIQSVQLSDYFPISLPRSAALITLAFVEFTEGPGETYFLPLIIPPHDQSCPPHSAVVRLPVPDHASDLPLLDALGNQEFLAAILSVIVSASSFTGQNGVLQGAPEEALNEKKVAGASALKPRLLDGEQSNSSVAYGDNFILKFFRRLEDGIHPDLEIGRFLTSVAHFANVPLLCGSLTYESYESKKMTIGVLQRFIPNRGDAWRFTVQILAGHFASLDHPIGETLSGSIRAPDAKSHSSILAFSEPLAKDMELIGLLGRRTAELHLALASSSADPAFAPETFTLEVREEQERAFHDLVVQNFELLRLKVAELPESVAELANQILKLEDDALLLLHSIVQKEISSIRTRIHGDYHLGQVLFTGSDYFIIDFEGEPARPLSERRNKRSPLQDVAGMLRSFHYAARAAWIAAEEHLLNLHESEAPIATIASQWQALASSEFLRSYRNTAGDAKFLPPDSAEFDALLKVFLLEKAVYELGYELNNRPAWLSIPLEGIRDILTAKS